jgi:tetratricopeptide (TPR) repeat protein
LNDLKQLAHVLLSGANWGRAEELLTGFLDADPIANQRADYSIFWTQRGAARLGAGRTDEACDDFRIANLPDAPCLDLSLLALGRLAAGDHEGYQDTCSTMLDSPRETLNPSQLHWVAWSCALGSFEAGRDAEIRTLAEDAVTLNPGRREALLALGATQYRLGEFELAVQTLLAADSAVASDARFEGYAWFFLALAHHQLGNDTEAEQWRQQSLEYTDQLFSESDEFVSWSHRKTLELLRDEMEREFSGSVEHAPVATE